MSVSLDVGGLPIPTDSTTLGIVFFVIVLGVLYARYSRGKKESSTGMGIKQGKPDFLVDDTVVSPASPSQNLFKLPSYRISAHQEAGFPLNAKSLTLPSQRIIPQQQALSPEQLSSKVVSNGHSADDMQEMQYIVSKRKELLAQADAMENMVRQIRENLGAVSSVVSAPPASSPVAQNQPLPVQQVKRKPVVEEPFVPQLIRIEKGKGDREDEKARQITLSLSENDEEL